MPQPEVVEAATARLLAVYETADADIKARLAALSDDPRTAGQRRRLRELQREVGRLMDATERQARAWLERDLPVTYAYGARTAAAVTGVPFEWAQIHVEAVQSLAEEAWGDLLAASRHVRRDTKALIRLIARERTIGAVAGGDTAQQAGRRMARLLEDRGIAAVTYRNGARHAIGDYADVVVRTVSAKSYVMGSLNQGTAAGVTHFLCLDGSECGLEAHDAGEKPNGRVYPAATAYAYPLAHPRCARSWGAVPGVTTTAEAEERGLVPSAAQQADQAAFEADRETAQRARAARRARQGRSPRQPRAARAG